MSNRTRFLRWMILGTSIFSGGNGIAGHISISPLEKETHPLPREAVHREGRPRNEKHLVAALDHKPVSTYRELNQALAIKHLAFGQDIPARFKIFSRLVYAELQEYRDAHRNVYDVHHPFYARLLSDPRFADSILRKVQANEQRFEYSQPFLWIVVEGMSTYDVSSSNVGSPVPTSQAVSDIPVPGSSIPEPRAGCLMVLGVLGVTLAVAWIRRVEPCRAQLCLL